MIDIREKLDAIGPYVPAPDDCLLYTSDAADEL